MRASRPGARRLVRHREGGFTLLELVVATAILTLVAGAIATAFNIGVTVLRPDGVKARLAADHDLEFLEQLIGEDGARAVCITVDGNVYGEWPAGHTPATCASSTGYGTVSACSGTSPTVVLCFGWVVLGTDYPNFLTATCDVAVYSAQPTVPNDLQRTVWSASYDQATHEWSSTQVGQTIIDHQYSVVIHPPATISSYTPTGEGYPWIRSLPVTVTAVTTSSGTIANAPSSQMIVHPVASDPDGIAAAVTSVGAVC